MEIPKRVEQMEERIRKMQIKAKRSTIRWTAIVKVCLLTNLAILMFTGQYYAMYWCAITLGMFWWYSWFVAKITSDNERSYGSLMKLQLKGMKLTTALFSQVIEQQEIIKKLEKKNGRNTRRKGKAGKAKTKA